MSFFLIISFLRKGRLGLAEARKKEEANVERKAVANRRTDITPPSTSLISPHGWAVLALIPQLFCGPPLPSTSSKTSLPPILTSHAVLGFSVISFLHTV